MPWDDHDSDFFDGFTDGLFFSNIGCGWYIIIVIVCSSYSLRMLNYLFYQ